MRSSQVLHLTNVNPHITGVLNSSKYASRHASKGSPLVRMCRQNAAAALDRRRGGVACGVGSFAFQGTNGQAVMRAGPEAETGPRPVVGARSALCLLDRQRFWARRQPGEGADVSGDFFYIFFLFLRYQPRFDTNVTRPPPHLYTGTFCFSSAHYGCEHCLSAYSSRLARTMTCLVLAKKIKIKLPNTGLAMTILSGVAAASRGAAQFRGFIQRP